MVNTSARTQGVLYIVATPIGHCDDITLRALNTLKSVDIILAEDTRHSVVLLNLLGIKKPLVSLHAHNEHDKTKGIINSLLEGKSYALISDAGTPLISDPGYPLVYHAREQGISVVPIPGACALITALSVAGLPCDAFSFFGFLPAKRSNRQAQLRTAQKIEHTLVFYESTHRIVECIRDIEIVFGANMDMVLAKELTKTFETLIKGNTTVLTEWLLNDPNHCKGEFVLILPPRAPEQHSQENIIHTLKTLLNELPLKQAVKLASKITDCPKNDVYKLALTLQDNP